MNKYLITFLLLFISANMSAQNAAFLKEGSIVYEKRINMHALIDKSIDDDNEWGKQIAKEYKKKKAQFKTVNYVLNFNENKSLYQLDNPEEVAKGFDPEENLGNENMIQTDIQNRHSIAKRKFFEENFIVQDSIRKFIWKITDEYRDIAGFQCRRANGLMFDSVYVVAFFTNQIIPSFGPESFNGLPGTILGVALPHDNITWFAQKVVAKKIPETQLTFPKKGKKVSQSEMLSAIQPVLKEVPEKMRNELLRKFLL